MAVLILKLGGKKMESLYRIVSFPGFVNLVESKTERFVQPTAWEDTYEGYMLRLLEDSSKHKDVLRVLYELYEKYLRIMFLQL